MKIKLGIVLELNNMLKAIIDNTELKIDSLLKFKLLGILKNIEIPVNNFEAVRNERFENMGKKMMKETLVFQQMIQNLWKSSLMI